MALQGVPFEQLGVPWDRPATVALPPVAILQVPFSTWGIAYDLYLHDMEDALGGGWDKHRGACVNTRIPNTSLTTAAASIYREIAKHLTERGFYRAQYSVWQRRGTAAHAWHSMMGLRSIRPHGVFATVVRRLQMFRVPRRHVLVVTNQVRLGGIFSPNLLGPTPADLAVGIGHIPPANWPNNQGDRLPPGVRQGPTSWNADNWRIA